MIDFLVLVIISFHSVKITFLFVLENSLISLLIHIILVDDFPGMTVPMRYFFCSSFLIFMFCVCHAFASVHC